MYTGEFRKEWAKEEWVKDVPAPFPNMAWYFFTAPFDIIVEDEKTFIYVLKEADSHDLLKKRDDDMLASEHDFGSHLSSCFKLEGSLQLDGCGNIAKGAFA